MAALGWDRICPVASSAAAAVADSLERALVMRSSRSRGLRERETEHPRHLHGAQTESFTVGG